MFPCALGPQLHSSSQSLGTPHHCWGHSALWWPRAFPSCWLEHRVHAAQGQLSPPPGGVHKAGAQGGSFFLGSVSSSILPAPVSPLRESTLDSGGRSQGLDALEGPWGECVLGSGRVKGSREQGILGSAHVPNPWCFPLGGRCQSPSILQGIPSRR